MDPQQDNGITQKISIIRRHIDKVLILAAGIAILLSGYFTLDYRSYTNCQAQHLEASHNTNVVFAESLRTLLSQPSRPIEERRQALERLQVALDRQYALDEQLGDCQ